MISRAYIFANLRILAISHGYKLVCFFKKIIASLWHIEFFHVFFANI